MIVLMLMLLSYLIGRRTELKKRIEYLDSHLEWLRKFGTDWREIAIGYAVIEEGLSADLIADLKRVAMRLKEEQKWNEHRSDL